MRRNRGKCFWQDGRPGRRRKEETFLSSSEWNIPFFFLSQCWNGPDSSFLKGTTLPLSLSFGRGHQARFTSVSHTVHRKRRRGEKNIFSFFLGLEDGNFISDRKTFPPESTRCACAQSIRNLLLLLETTPDDLNGKKSADESTLIFRLFPYRLLRIPRNGHNHSNPLILLLQQRWILLYLASH